MVRHDVWSLRELTAAPPHVSICMVSHVSTARRGEQGLGPSLITGMLVGSACHDWMVTRQQQGFSCAENPHASEPVAMLQVSDDAKKRVEASKK